MLETASIVSNMTERRQIQRRHLFVSPFIVCSYDPRRVIIFRLAGVVSVGGGMTETLHVGFQNDKKLLLVVVGCQRRDVKRRYGSSG